MSLSFIALLLQFHGNASYLVTLSCFIYKMKLNKRYCWQLPRNVVWFLDGPCMTNDVGTISCANSSNLVKLKLVKDLNKLGVSHMVIKTSCMPMLRFINCSPPSSNSVGVKKSQVLTHDYGLHHNLLFNINLIKELPVATWGAWVKTRRNKLHK